MSVAMALVWSKNGGPKKTTNNFVEKFCSTKHFVELCVQIRIQHHKGATRTYIHHTIMHKPTESELAILHLLWAKGSATVREVNESLNAAAEQQGRLQEIGYTTTLKIMQIMHEKRMVARDEDGRTHYYTALVREQDTKGLLLQNFVDSAFKGAAMDMVMHALGDHAASRDELDKIKALIAAMEQKLPEDPSAAS